MQFKHYLLVRMKYCQNTLAFIYCWPFYYYNKNPSFISPITSSASQMKHTVLKKESLRIFVKLKKMQSTRIQLPDQRWRIYNRVIRKGVGEI